MTKPGRQSELYDNLAPLIGITKIEQEEHPAARQPQQEKETGTRTRLLVAEDNPVNQRVAVRMLENLSYRVDVVENGREALKALKQTPYAAVLMDIQMPELDGYEATREIRRREGDEEGRTPIITMTANAMRGDREKALEAGMDDYISKPIRAEALDEVLKSWIRSGPHLAEAPTEEAPATQKDAVYPIDREVLEELRELGDEELIVELVHMFLEDASTQLASLRLSISEDAASSVERTAHTLKGSSGHLGAHLMVDLCAKLQEAGESRDLTNAPGLLRQLEIEFDRVSLALGEILEETEIAGRG